MKTVKAVLIILLLFVIIPGFGYFLWVVQKETKIDLMIVNKTVEKLKQNEFKSLNWALNYCKIVKSSSNSYDYQRDYFGYFPEPTYENAYIQGFKLSELSFLKDKYEGLIYLDCKGVGNTISATGQKSFYGGFNQSDFLLFKEMMGANKLVIAEYNFFSEPTEDLVRFNTEQLIDVYSVLWEGKFMNQLDREKVSVDLDEKWIEQYKENTGKNWEFKGSGLVLINEKKNRILVLPSDQYMTAAYPSILTNAELAAFYGVKESIPYCGWFQMVYEGKNEVISSFDLNLNEEGKQVLMSNGLEYHFPATIALAKPHQYFFAGDFSKQKVSLGFSKNRIVSQMTKTICKMRGDKPSEFFHNYYMPMYTTILKNYSASLSNEKSSE